MQEFKKKKIHGSGNTTLIISNEEMNDIIKIIQALENFHILIKGVTKTIARAGTGHPLSSTSKKERDF